MSRDQVLGVLAFAALVVAIIIVCDAIGVQ